MKIEKQIQAHLDAAYEIAMQEVVRLARAVMRNPSSGVTSFCMGMGTISLWNDRTGEPVDAFDDRGRPKRWAAPLFRFMDEYGQTLGIWGTPLKIDGPDAPAKRDW